MVGRSGDRFKSYEQEQAELLPRYVAEGPEASDAVFCIHEVVEELDLSAFEARYSAVGEHAYSPRMLLKLWLFAAVEGVYSGRELARRLRWDLRLRYLAGGGRYPDFRTINRFRVRHAHDFAEVLKQTSDLARRAGLVRLGLVTVDGTKLRANTSRHKAMSHARMVKEEKRLQAEIREITRRMEEINAEEDRSYGSDDDDDRGLPEELQDRHKRRERIRELRAELEAEKGEKLKGSHQKSFADPQAQMMMTGEGSPQYAYNAQAAVSRDGLIVAADMTRNASDVEELVPMAAAVERTVGERAELIVADKGYLSEKALGQMKAMGQRCLVATGREGRGRGSGQGNRFRKLWTVRYGWAGRSIATGNERRRESDRSPKSKLR